MRAKVSTNSPCMKGYPCPHMRDNGLGATCMYGACQLTRIEDTVYDAISGETMPWVTVERRPAKERREPEDERYDAFLARYGLKQMMESANTYGTKAGGIIRQKRVAFV